MPENAPVPLTLLIQLILAVLGNRAVRANSDGRIVELTGSETDGANDGNRGTGPRRKTLV
jgi:hypothetical protein